MLIWILHIALTSALCAVGVNEFVDGWCDQLKQGVSQHYMPQKIARHLQNSSLSFNPLFSKLQVRSLNEFVLCSDSLSSDSLKKKKEILEPLKTSIERICDTMCESQEPECYKERLRELLSLIHI